MANPLSQEFWDEYSKEVTAFFDNFICELCDSICELRDELEKVKPPKPKKEEVSPTSKKF